MRESIFFLALASTVSGISLRVIEPMLPQLADEFGTSIPAAAIVITAFSLAYAVGQLVYGPLGDRFGKLRVVTLSLLGATASTLGCAFAPDLGSLTVLRFLSALFASASLTLGIAFIGDCVPIAERQSVIARFMTGTIIGQALGPLIGGFSADLIHWRGTFLFLAALFALAVAVLFLRTRAEWPGSGRPDSGGNAYTAHLRLLATSPVRYVMGATFVETFFYFGIYSFLGAYLTLAFNLNLSLVGAILAAVGVGCLLYTLAVERLLQALGQHGMVAWGGAICCFCSVVTVLAPAWIVAVPCALGIGFSFYMVQNTLQTKASEMAPQARGAGVSLYTSSWSFGQAGGVAVMGIAVSFVGYAPAIIAFAVGFLCLGVWLRCILYRLS